jgi:peptidoglycan hydrolase CwlO-like protein
MSDNNLPPEVQLALLRAQQSQGSAITLQGINKYWPQIVGAVAIGWFLVGQGKEQQALQGRVATLEKAAESVVQVKADQQKTSTEVGELRMTVKSIQTGQEELAKRMESVGSDLRALSAQVQAISQALRGR